VNVGFCDLAFRGFYAGYGERGVSVNIGVGRCGFLEWLGRDDDGWLRFVVF
jgi:hypothetical protein